MTSEISIGDLAFAADIAGPQDGPPVLFLHGFPQSRLSWTHQVETLSKAGYRCIAPDQRGYSPGARPAGDAYAVPQLTGDALAIMDALGHDRFHVVGHDWGGQLSWLIAGLYAPQRVISLSVLSRPHPAAFVKAMREDAAQSGRSAHHRAFQDGSAAQGIRESGFAGFRKMFETQGVPAATAEAYIALLSEPGALDAAIAWYRQAPSTAPNPETAAPIRVPTLYVWGDEDATVGRPAAEGTAAYVDADYRFEEISGGGHFLSDQFPEQISALLLEHLRSN